MTLKYVNTVWLNVRTGPGTTFRAIYALPKGTDITVDIDHPISANGWHWVQRLKYPGLWVANELLSDNNPLSSGNPLRVGFHLSQFRYNKPRLLAMMGRLHAKHTPMPFMLILGDTEPLVQDFIDVSPDTLYAMRIYRENNDSLMPAPQYFGTYVDHNPNRTKIRYHVISILNTQFDPATMQWWIDQMDWTEAHGYRLVVPCWATGNPGDLGVWKRSDVWRFIRHIRDRGHLFGLQEYDMGDGDWNLWRFHDHVYPLLPLDIQTNMPLMVMEEFGRSYCGQMSKEALVSVWRTDNARALSLPYKVYLAEWCCGDSGGYMPDNYGENMEALEEVVPTPA